MDPGEQEANSLYRNLTAVIISMNNLVNKVVLKTLGNVMNNETMRMHIDELSPYIYTIAFLSYAGRDINEDNISSVMSAVGKIPDPQMLNLVMSIRMKSHIIYVYSIYYLIVNGISIDVNNIAEVAASVGVTPDDAAIEDVLQIYNKGNQP